MKTYTNTDTERNYSGTVRLIFCILFAVVGCLGLCRLCCPTRYSAGVHCNSQHCRAEEYY